MYVGLALIRLPNGRIYLFEAPAFAHLKPKDDVIVDTVNGEKQGTVVLFDSYDDRSNGYAMLIKATDATRPLKRVLKKIRYETLTYSEDDDGTDNNNE